MASATCVLVVLADESSFRAARQVFESAVIGGGWDGDRLLLTDCVDSSSLQDFEREGIEILHRRSFEEDQSWPKDWSVANVGRKVMKFHIFDPYFRKWRSLLYLDIDTIVVGPIRHLGRVRGFWAAPDHNLRLRNQFVDPGSIAKRGYDMRRTSFNSGVLAFNTDLIQDDTVNDLLRLTRSCFSALRFTDQPILNLYFYERWHRLSQAYNFFPMIMRKSMVANPATSSILHFPGRMRPWEPDNPFHGLWAGNLREFGQAREIPRRSIRNALKRVVAYLHPFALWQIKRRLRTSFPRLYAYCKRRIGRSNP